MLPSYLSLLVLAKSVALLLEHVPRAAVVIPAVPREVLPARVPRLRVGEDEEEPGLEPRHGLEHEHLRHERVLLLLRHRRRRAAAAREEVLPEERPKELRVEALGAARAEELEEVEAAVVRAGELKVYELDGAGAIRDDVARLEVAVAEHQRQAEALEAGLGVVHGLLEVVQHDALGQRAALVRHRIDVAQHLPHGEHEDAVAGVAGVAPERLGDGRAVQLRQRLGHAQGERAVAAVDVVLGERQAREHLVAEPVVALIEEVGGDAEMRRHLVHGGAVQRVDAQLGELAEELDDEAGAAAGAGTREPRGPALHVAAVDPVAEPGAQLLHADRGVAPRLVLHDGGFLEHGEDAALVLRRDLGVVGQDARCDALHGVAGRAAHMARW
mmetsp:Transcript_36458/g.114298  ORF Transcript_36458/g.114298 Transcript_36458/m.114298 type:complete len:385 (-) Transcript_36458:220-1374(-)